MHVILAALVAASGLLSFHLVPTPDDMTIRPSFQLGGYSVPATCTPEVDIDQNTCQRTRTDAIGFIPETDTTYGAALASFTAPVTGTCVGAETETIDGVSHFIASPNSVDVEKGAFVTLPIVLPSTADYPPDSADTHDLGTLLQAHYRIVVGCMPANGAGMVLSSIYELDFANTGTSVGPL